MGGPERPSTRGLASASTAAAHAAGTRLAWEHRVLGREGGARKAIEQVSVNFKRLKSFNVWCPHSNKLYIINTTKLETLT